MRNVYTKIWKCIQKTKPDLFIYFIYFGRLTISLNVLSLSLMDSQMLDFFLKPGLCVSFSLYIAKFWHNIAVIENDTYGPQSRGEVALVYTAKRHLSMRMIHLLQLYLMENAKEDWMEHDKGLEMMVVRYFRQ